ncbi:DoxX family membrane protein [Halosegnis marinus]|uniref:DoxX family membrane protein n=1 Tax=Halosegnis marinus TaxID=3034023 RepID=UPI003607C982
MPDLAVLADTLDGYRDLVPWMLRLSVGLPTLGAGFAGYYLSPAVPTGSVSEALTAAYPDVLAPLVAPPVVRLLLIGVGFALLTGFLTRATAAVGALLWLTVVPVAPDLLLAMEYPVLFGALVLTGGGRPSADEMFARVAQAEGTYYRRIDPLGEWPRRVRTALIPARRYLPTLLRVGLGGAFVFLGVTQKLLDPARAALVVEKYGLTGVVPVEPGMWVVGAGLTEAGLGLLLLAGLFTRGGAALAFVVLTTTLFGLPDDPVLAHVSVFGLASAVFTLGAGPLSLDRLLADRLASRGDAGRAEGDPAATGD